MTVRETAAATGKAERSARRWTGKGDRMAAAGHGTAAELARRMLPATVPHTARAVRREPARGRQPGPS